MMDKLMKLMEKKKAEGKGLDPMRAKAKMSMLEALKDEMSGMMAGDLHGEKMAKAEVIAPDKESLKIGLEKASQIVDKSKMPELEDEEESPEHEAMESSDEEMKEQDEEALMDAYKMAPSKENLEKLMLCLEAKKEKMA